MRISFYVTAFLFAAAGCTDRSATPKVQPTAQDTEGLRQVQIIELPGVEGRFDHFAADVKGNRLYLAALGNNTLEVIDMAQGKRVESVKGLRKPTGVAFVPDTGRVVVANGDDGTLRFYDATTLKPAGQLSGFDDADKVRYAAPSKRLYVGYGSGALGVVDAVKQEKIGDIKLDAHPESFQLERDGQRIFVNIPEAKQIAVVDREKSTVVAKWPVMETKANFPMAIDHENHRLLVGCREPAKLLVIDMATGKTVVSLPCAGDTDDLFYDVATRRIYVSGGEGVISVIAQKSAHEYGLIGTVKTAAGARTSYFVSDVKKIYLAVPHRGDQKAELRVFEVSSGQP